MSCASGEEDELKREKDKAGFRDLKMSPLKEWQTKQDA